MTLDRASTPPAAAGDAPPVPRAVMSLTEWGMLFGLSAIWGGSFFFNKVLLGVFEPFTIVLGRTALAALALVAFVYASGGALPRSRAAWRMFAGMSALNNLVPFVLILWGQKHIASGLAAILNATTPLFAAVLAHLLAGERLTAHRLAGVLIGVAGVAVMMGPDVAASGLSGSVLAQLAVLGAALSYGLSSLYARRLAALRIAPQAAAAGQLAISALVTLPVALALDRPWALPAPPLEAWAALAGLAFVSTAFAYVIFFRVLAGAGGVNASLVTLLVPAWAILLGTAVLGEVFTLREAAGMGVILLGLAVTDGRVLRFLRRRQRVAAERRH